MSSVVIIGGGAAGMMCAVLLAQKGIQVTLVEKNAKLGRKLGITGKGRCNLTNACDTDTLIKNTVSNPRFMYSAFSGFNASDAVAFFEENGLKTKVERGNRVFPVSDKAQDVIAVLERLLKKYKVNVIRNCEVRDIRVSQSEEGAKVTGVFVRRDGNKEELSADIYVLATGGLSYPLTGSTGDGFTFAKKLGLVVKEGSPSLVQLYCKEGCCHDMAGLTLKNTALSLYAKGEKKEKLIYSDFGELLFTHSGISGPIALSASAMLGKCEGCKVRITLDLKPALDADALNKRILRDFEAKKNKQFQNSLDDLLPKSMIPVMVTLSEIDPHKQVNAVTREERQRLVGLLKEFPLTVTGTGGMDEAIITRGGISVKEVDPKTMRIKKYENLYVAGELIDVDAFTGGFNLQIAWSTAWAAAQAIADL